MKHIQLFFVFVTIALLLTAISGVGLAWDGSYWLFTILDSQTPLAFYGRLTHIPLNWIEVAASSLTSDMLVLRTLFGGIYGAITLAALLAAWWIVRPRPETRGLYVWSALGIGLVTLPGQVCALCQADLIVQLFWPLLLAILLRMPRRALPVVAVFLPMIFFFHPSAIVLFTGAALLAVIVGWRYRADRRRMWLWALGFATVSSLAAVRFFVLHSDYEVGQLSLQVLQARYYESLAGLPVIALALVCFAALLILLEPSALHITPFNLAPISGFARRGPMIALTSIVIAGALFVIWGSDPHQWREELNYRAWALFASLPFMLFATLDSFRAHSDPTHAVANDSLRYRGNVVQIIGVIFLLVLGAQSFAWIGLTDKLRATMQASPSTCISAPSIAWLATTPLYHWGTTTYSLLIQSRQPHKIILGGNGCDEATFSEGIPIAIFDVGHWHLRGGLGGWFDLSPLAQQLTSEQDTPPSCEFPLTAGWYTIEKSDEGWWRWTSGRARMRVLVAQDAQAALAGTFISIRRPNQVDILVNGEKQASVDVTLDGQPFGPLTIPLREGENRVEFVSHNPPVLLPNDSRPLAIAVKNLTLTIGDGIAVCKRPG